MSEKNNLTRLKGRIMSGFNESAEINWAMGGKEVEEFEYYLCDEMDPIIADRDQFAERLGVATKTICLQLDNMAELHIKLSKMIQSLQSNEEIKDRIIDKLEARARLDQRILKSTQEELEQARETIDEHNARHSEEK